MRSSETCSKPVCLYWHPFLRNNLGNTNAGMGDWQAAADCFGRAAALAPAFSFAAANEAVARYQLGQDNRAIKQMRWVNGSSKCVRVGSK